MKTRFSKLLIIAVCQIALLTGCGTRDRPPKQADYWENHCDGTKIEARSNFILQCAKNANPMSDEEPEDLVKQCERTSLNLYCPKREVTVTFAEGSKYTRAKVEIKMSSEHIDDGSKQ